MKIACYLRNASGTQNDSISKCRIQLEYIEKYCANTGLSKPIIFADPIASGLDNTRPGLRSLLCAAHDKHFDILLVDDLNRLTRDIGELIKLNNLFCDLGIRVISISDLGRKS